MSAKRSPPKAPRAPADNGSPRGHSGRSDTERSEVTPDRGEGHRASEWGKVERLIGTIRRELLDRLFFRDALDLERKLQEFRGYYNGSRVHLSLGSSTPVEQAGKPRQTCAALERFGWRENYRGLFQTPVAA